MQLLVIILICLLVLYSTIYIPDTTVTIHSDSIFINYTIFLYFEFQRVMKRIVKRYIFDVQRENDISEGNIRQFLNSIIIEYFDSNFLNVLRKQIDVLFYKMSNQNICNFIHLIGIQRIDVKH